MVDRIANLWAERTACTGSRVVGQGGPTSRTGSHSRGRRPLGPVGRRPVKQRRRVRHRRQGRADGRCVRPCDGCAEPQAAGTQGSLRQPAVGELRRPADPSVTVTATASSRRTGTPRGGRIVAESMQSLADKGPSRRFVHERSVVPRGVLRARGVIGEAGLSTRHMDGNTRRARQLSSARQRLLCTHGKPPDTTRRV